MEAVISKQVSRAVNYSPRKEMVAAYAVAGMVNGELREVVTAVAYMGRSSHASVVYASLWVRGDHHTSGSGSAGGYGYHKESAAFMEAIDAAGIRLSGDIDGRGDSAMQAAFEAIARAAGATGPLLFIRH